MESASPPTMIQGAAKFARLIKAPPPVLAYLNSAPILLVYQGHGG